MLWRVHRRVQETYWFVLQNFQKESERVSIGAWGIGKQKGQDQTQIVYCTWGKRVSINILKRVGSGMSFLEDCFFIMSILGKCTKFPAKKSLHLEAQEMSLWLLWTSSIYYLF